MNPTFIFIDGSYYCFHRYYALLQWWKNAFPDELLEDPNKNNIFVDKFKKTFIENIQQITKKLKISKSIQPILLVGKDCKRENIWRKELFSDYKGTRVYDEKFMGVPFFQMAYENKLFELGGVKTILKHSRLEADDCIAISVKYLINKYPECNIYIITSDRDYLQLNSPNVKLFNLSFKNIAENKNCTGNAKKDLEIKIIMGDICDNIPSIFPKCGPKTALKCIEDNNFFKKKIDENTNYIIQYELNQKLINFDYIPKKLVDEFLPSIHSLEF
jgi:5'-3' exonuclease